MNYRKIYAFLGIMCLACAANAQNTANGIQDKSAKKEVAAPKFFVAADFSKSAGKMKPLHGVNNSPIVLDGEIPSFRDAGIPFVRLHDTGGKYGGACFVDIPNVFPNFDADPEDPKSYDFAFTDALLKTLHNSGCEIFYRLGVTIENEWKIKAMRINPPKDNLKWAKICEGIIRHYNEGWADGFHFNIKYWEIWNEPENPPMWTGTKEQYFELYKVAANHLKKRFPDIKVGGYAGCGFYAVTHPDWPPFHKSFVTYFNDFLKYITTSETAAPLDFFSWHLYAGDPYEIGKHAEYVASRLKHYGLGSAENIFDEWNCIDGGKDMYDRMKELPAALFVASAFCVMQKSPIDKAMYYVAEPESSYCGMYKYPSKDLAPPYFSFKAFNELYKLGTAVECSSAGAGIFTCAAVSVDGARGAVMIVNRNANDVYADFTFNGMGKVDSVLVLDRNYLLTEVGGLIKNGKILLPRQSVVVVRFSK